MTKKEKYREFVYEEFYGNITKLYIEYNSIHYFDMSTPLLFMETFYNEFEYRYNMSMYNLLGWVETFTHNYYGFLYDEDQLEITKSFFKRFYNEISSHIEKSDSLGDLDFPYGKWLIDNFDYYYGKVNI